MQKPYLPGNEENNMICPDCGSTNVNKDPSSTVKIGDKKIDEYVCSDCKITFIPAMVSKDATKVEKWAKKMGTQMELNEGKSYKKEQPVYITIKEVPLMENVTLSRNDVINKVFGMLAQDKAFTKQSLIREVALDLLSQKLNASKKDEVKATEQATKIVQKLFEGLE